MKAVLRRENPYEYYLICEGIKKVVISKNMPVAADWEHRVELYCVNNIESFNRIPKKYQDAYRSHLGKVGACFICDAIDVIPPCTTHDGLHYPLVSRPELGILVEKACLTPTELYLYGVKKVNGCYGDHSKVVPLYAWHISGLMTYFRPRELGEFKHTCITPNYPFCPECKFGNVQYSPDEVENKQDLEGANCEWLCLRDVNLAPHTWFYIEK